MTKYFPAAAAAILLLAACMPANQDDAVVNASNALASASATIVKAKFPKSETAEIPSVINISSSVGEVIFRHQAHFKDRAIGCAECHHQINAKKLSTPHPDYLKSSGVNCKVCHDETGNIRQQVYSCSECHNSHPIDIADETLSSKVVIHKQCWKCHAVSTGKEASKGCEKCHSGNKTL